MPAISESTDRLHAAYEYGRCIGAGESMRVVLDFMWKMLRDHDKIADISRTLMAAEGVHNEVHASNREGHEQDPFIRDLRASLDAAARSEQGLDDD